jgi:acetyl/propionyl-CoA carboxylase alpha subunit
MQRALREYHIEGIQTNISFFLEILNDPDFRRGDFDTGFIDRWMQSRKTESKLSDLDRDLAAIAAAIFHSDRSGPVTEAAREAESPWKVDGRRRGLRTS